MTGGIVKKRRFGAITAAVLVGGLLISGCIQSVEGKATAAGPMSAPTQTRSVTPSRTPPSQTAPTKTPTTTSPEAAGVPGPMTPKGWQSVASKRGLTYDVPPGWKIYSPGTMIGWENEQGPIRTMTGASALESTDCENFSRAMAGVPGTKTKDLSAAARADASNIKAIFTSDSGHVPNVTLSEARDFQVSGHPAVELSATVTGIEREDGCTAPAAQYTVVATTSATEADAVIFIVTTDQEIPGAPDPGVVAQIVATLRRT